ncbi:MAG: hypothetical protein CMN31_08670 [Sandaracinus sp.]|nr:hypothetical protein [Myxococcales bacterium]MAT29647.1 hypothetical protein [Sandaracinus sp.]MBJ71400.1 hypothetical protein [Sandaracinus sp.]
MVTTWPIHSSLASLGQPSPRRVWRTSTWSTPSTERAPTTRIESPEPMPAETTITSSSASRITRKPGETSEGRTRTSCTATSSPPVGAGVATTSVG